MDGLQHCLVESVRFHGAGSNQALKSSVEVICGTNSHRRAQIKASISMNRQFQLSALYDGSSVLLSHDLM